MYTVTLLLILRVHNFFLLHYYTKSGHYLNFIGNVTTFQTGSFLSLHITLNEHISDD